MAQVGNLEDTVLGEIKSFVIDRLIMGGLKFILGLLNPAAAFIKACQMIYDLVMWFADNASRIKELLDAVLDSIRAIVAGNVETMANAIDTTLGGILPRVISFLGDLAGVGGITERIHEIILKVRKPITRAMDALLGKAITYGRGILRRLGRTGVGQAAVAATNKATAAVATGKAWAKDKATAAGQALGLIKRPFEIGTEHHTLSGDPATGRIRMASEEGPVEAKVRERVARMQDRWKSEGRTLPGDLEAQVGTVMAQIRIAETRVAAAKSASDPRASDALDTLGTVISGFFRHLGPLATTTHSPTPGVGNIAPYGRQVSSNNNDPLPNRHLEKEHILPFFLGGMLFKALGVPLAKRAAESEIDKGQHTIMIYESAADRKTRGETIERNGKLFEDVGSDQSQYLILTSLMETGAPNFAGDTKFTRSKIGPSSETRRLPKSERRRLEAQYTESRRRQIMDGLPSKLSGLMNSRVERTIKCVQHPAESAPDKMADRGHSDLRPDPDRIRTAAALQAQDILRFVTERLHER
jgi:hypothetical protein